VAYQSLYRKYRPQRFAELVGQAHVVAALRNAVRDERVGHAYLFSGPRGTGKTTTARLLAKALNCSNRGDDGDPCGVCENCVAIAEGSSLDVIEVDAASKSRVEEMRDLLERVAYLSAGGGKKVYILDEVHMLSASAEAALLKTLEESPEHVVFVLATTDPLKVAPTIRSRTQHYVFGLYSAEELEAHLTDVCAKEGIAAGADALAIIARAGAGSMRDSLSLLDQAIAHGAVNVEQVGALFGGTAFDMRVAILDAVASENVAGALVTVGELLDAGHEPRRLTEDLLATTRDAFLLTAAKGRVRVDAPEDDQARLSALGEQTGPALLVRTLETLGQAIVDMRGTDAADPRLVLEIALVRLARRDVGPPLQVLADRIDRLERANSGGVDSDRAKSSTDPTAAARPGRTLSELRQARGDRPSEVPAVGEPGLDVEPTPDPEPAPPAAPLELDDVILAWANILPGLPPATRGAVREAQPLALEADVITFGVPKGLYEAARPRFHKEADNIRDALSSRLGRRLKFKLQPHDGFVEPAPVATPAPADEMIELDELIDLPAEGAAVDSVGLFTSRFDATVVEEVPRD